MSLINKMLRDLDRRNAPDLDRSGLPAHIQALPPEPAAVPRWVPLLILLAAVGGGYLLLGRDEPPPQPQPLPVMPAPKVVAPPPAPVAPSPAVEMPEPLKEPVPIVVEPVPVLPPAKPKPDAAVLRSETKPVAGRKPPGDVSAVVSPGPAAAAKPLPAIPVVPVEVAIDKRPRSAPVNEAADAEYRKAITAVRRGAVSEAMERLHAALKIDGRHASARQALLSLMVEQQQLAEAQALMEEGLTLDPAQSGWAMALARLQVEGGKTPEALDTLARHAAQAGQNADYQAFYALLLQRQKRSREAAEHYRAALALRPAEARWWYGLGLALEADQKAQEAREAFLKARESGNLPAELAAAVEQKLR